MEAPDSTAGYRPRSSRLSRRDSSPSDCGRALSSQTAASRTGPMTDVPGQDRLFKPHPQARGPEGEKWAHFENQSLRTRES